MGLDVHQANARVQGDARERLNLANDQICYLDRPQLHLASAKLLAIRKTRMGTDGDAVFPRQGYRGRASLPNCPACTPQATLADVMHRINAAS
jgi:hypothetical protein